MLIQYMAFCAFFVITSFYAIFRNRDYKVVVQKQKIVYNDG